MPNILFLTGSPRPYGSSATLAEYVLDGMRGAADITVERVDTSRLENKYHGCSSCYGCQPMKFRCIINDATARLINRISEFDHILLATPIYFFNISAQLKAFTDRFMALCSYDEHEQLVSKLRPIRMAAVITAEGDMDDSGLEVVRRWLDHLRVFTGTAPIPLLFQGGCGIDVKPTLTNDEWRQRAFDFGVNWIGGANLEG